MCNPIQCLGFSIAETHEIPLDYFFCHPKLRRPGRLHFIRKATSSEKLIAAYGRLKQTFDYFNTIDILPFTQTAHDRFAQLKQQKIRIGTRDLRIAAIALSVSGIVITRNQKDFAQVPDLVWENWTV